ncbi:MAG TPA: polysaccharide pyruvyl transferase family protein [Mycoplana sp.]|nr:polysaccharide pyruvyl transferase family protein [Mycoplana sp.]
MTAPAGEIAPVPSPSDAEQAQFDGKTVHVYHWTPPHGDGYTNFGDELSPMLVRRILDNSGFGSVAVAASAPDRPRLLAVGSILQQARDGDVIWGAGVNGKSWPKRLGKVRNLHIAAVRGPLTRGVLRRFGFDAPEIFGDPGLLFPGLFYREIAQAMQAVRQRYGAPEIVYIPNLNDERFLPERLGTAPGRVTLLSPRIGPVEMAAIVAQSRLVISSSLHGIVLADAYGIPCRAHLSAFEPIFKYLDYFQGVGRFDYAFHLSIEEALDAADLPPAVFDRHALLEAFPYEAIGLERPTAPR